MSSLNFIIILGRQPELGLVEVEALLGAEHVEPYGRFAALISEGLHVDRLGGAIKVAEIIYRGTTTALRNLPLDVSKLPMRDGKTPFALSAYGSRETPKMLMAAGLDLKKQLRERGSVRLITAGKGLAVSAAELRHNRVIEDGFELLVVMSGAEMIIARTLGVQDIDWYAKRDYDRPARSAKVGMLPPKLAQVLVNTTRSQPVYDPFCGTGVVLQEALLVDRAAQGSDLAEEMVQATRTNLDWLQAQVQAPLAKYAVALGDARTILLPKNCSIVTEGYLGPNLLKPPTIRELAVMRADLLDLYTSSLASWAKQLTSGSELTITAPAWRVGSTWHYLELVDHLAQLGYTLRSFEHVRTPLLYARADQVVGRQILLLRKN
jgi:tRNA G10  N-methylase Trm11